MTVVVVVETTIVGAVVMMTVAVAGMTTVVVDATMETAGLPTETTIGVVMILQLAAEMMWMIVVQRLAETILLQMTVVAMTVAETILQLEILVPTTVQRLVAMILLQMTVAETIRHAETILPLAAEMTAGTIRLPVAETMTGTMIVVGLPQEVATIVIQIWKPILGLLLETWTKRATNVLHRFVVEIPIKMIHHRRFVQDVVKSLLHPLQCQVLLGQLLHPPVAKSKKTTTILFLKAIRKKLLRLLRPLEKWLQPINLLPQQKLQPIVDHP